MATEDISRHLLQPGKHYVGTRMQQGRPLLDADWNEGVEYVADDRREALLATIGCDGTPDCGFQVGPDVLPVPTEEGQSIFAPVLNFDIAPGTFFIGGLRFELPEATTYFEQPDWYQALSQTPFQNPYQIPSEGGTDLIYLCGWEQAVTPIEDRELLDAALGGVDTTTRVRRVARVQARSDLSGSTCQELWDAFKADPVPGCPGATVDDQCRIVSPLRLTVGFGDPTMSMCPPCEPETIDGYRLREAQAIRVMITGGGTSFTWGFEDGAPLYRVLVGTGDGNVVTMQTVPKDDQHVPKIGQTVEILPQGSVLPNGERVAERLGQLRTISDVNRNPQGQYELKLNGSDVRFGMKGGDEEHPHFYMRVWRRGADLESPAEIPLEGDGGSDQHALGFTGLVVDFGLTNTIRGGCPGDYWVIAARPEVPDTVLPWSLMDGEAPHGPHIYCAPLALFQRESAAIEGTFEDCRASFVSLTRNRSWCTTTVGDGVISCGQFSTIQEAIDATPDGGRVCIQPGAYDEVFMIDGRKDLTIEGCGSDTFLDVTTGHSQNTVALIRGGSGIEIRNLKIRAEGYYGVRAEADSNGNVTDGLLLANLDIEARFESSNEPFSPVWIARSKSVTVRESILHQVGVSFGSYPDLFVAGEDLAIVRNEVTSTACWGGIQIGGDTKRVVVEHNEVSGGVGVGDRTRARALPREHRFLRTGAHHHQSSHRRLHVQLDVGQGPSDRR